MLTNLTDGVSCPACAGSSTSLFFSRRSVPIHQNLLKHCLEAAINTVRGDLFLTVCEACGFVFNSGFDGSLLLYGQNYENAQGHSNSFAAHVSERARHLVYDRTVRDCRIVEVGCGNGAFLRQLIRLHDGNRGFGFDPSYRGPEVEFTGRLEFFRDYYGPANADLKADVVVCRHLIEHIEHPFALLASIRSALAGSPGARVFIETPCVEWILEHCVLWDFFYEHCSYFSAGSLAAVLTRAGFCVDDISHVFGGQYLWCEASLADDASTSTSPGVIPGLARGFAKAEADNRRAWEDRVRELSIAGPVSLWGAGAKGVTFANLVDPGAEIVRCVIDLNPKKQGMFVPGTGHPIVDCRDAAAIGVRYAILMNPNYYAENVSLLEDLNLEIELIENPC